MEGTSKKRGRQAAKPKEAESAPLDTKPVAAVEAETGKGKRKTAPAGKAKKETAAKKVRVSDADGEPILEEAKVDAESVAPTKAKSTAAKKSRPKKDTATETATATSNEPAAPRVRRAAPKASAAAAAKNGTDDAAEPEGQENGTAVEEAQPTTAKRSRGKPSYKEEESVDESDQYVAKPTKGRRKAKETTEEKANEEVIPKKSAIKRSSQTKEAAAGSSAPAKPTARGRKKALVAEETTDDVADKPATKKQEETASTSSAAAKPAPRGRKKALAKEAVAPEETSQLPADRGDEPPVPKETSGNGVTQRKRGKDKADEKQEETDAAIVAPKGKKAKVAAPKMNKCATDYGSISFAAEDGEKPWNFKISSWNVAGLRSWVSKGGLEFLEHERPDILCVQETKCTEDKLPDEARHIPGYHPYWLCKPGGYAGVAIYSKKMPFHVTYGLGDAEQDQDGRLLTAEYEKFYLVCVYVPNAGNKLVTLPKRMRWDEKFHQYLAQLNGKKPVVLCGDMNVAHEEIDLANPKTNRKNAGFTQEERDGMTKLLSLGFVDTFRRLYPDRKSAYTFWTYMGGARAKNVGWRLDYFIVSERLVDKVTDNVIRSKVYGSDHCPVTLFLNI